jgi:poly(3-hydroxybutyrate) depolymerase
MKFVLSFAPFILQAMGSYVPFGMDNALTTSSVPEQFLSDVYLVGQSPSFTYRGDPRVSYTVYVPPDQYPAENSTTRKLPLLVDIHGTLRRMIAISSEGQHHDFAQRTGCAIVAPLFPAGLEGPNDVDSYKLMRTESLRSDLALLGIIDEIAYRWPGIETSQFYMMGFSGGGQFVHRFLYLHADRLAGVSIGAPGRVTYLDATKEWPEGVSDVQDVFNTTVNKDAIRNVPIQLVVGSEDTEIYSPAFWEWLHGVTGDGGLPPSNETRIDTLKKLRATWAEEGIETRLDVVPGVAHNSSDPAIRNAVYGYLGPLLESA